MEVPQNEELKKTYDSLLKYAEGLSMKEMCEHIVRAGFKKSDGSTPTAKEIFEYSPSGELFKIFDWFVEACLIIGPPDKTTLITADRKGTIDPSESKSDLDMENMGG